MDDKKESESRIGLAHFLAKAEMNWFYGIMTP